MTPVFLAIIQVVAEAVQGDKMALVLTLSGVNASVLLVELAMALRWSGKVDAEVKNICERLERIEKKADRHREDYI